MPEGRTRGREPSWFERDVRGYSDLEVGEPQVERRSWRAGVRKNRTKGSGGDPAIRREGRADLAAEVGSDDRRGGTRPGCGGRWGAGPALAGGSLRLQGRCPI